MPTLRATVTAKTGPAVQVTAQVLTNLKALHIDVARQVVMVEEEGKANREFDLTGVTTITDTITTTNHVVVIS
jgi:hypothetical protein